MLKTLNQNREEGLPGSFVGNVVGEVRDIPGYSIPPYTSLTPKPPRSNSIPGTSFQTKKYMT